MIEEMLILVFQFQRLEVIMSGKALYGRIARVESREITFFLIQKVEKEWELGNSIY